MHDRSSEKRKLDFDCSDSTFRDAFRKASQLTFPVEKILPEAIKKRLEPIAAFHNTTMCMLLAGLLPSICVVMSTAKIQVRRKLRHISMYSLVGAQPGSGKSAAFDVVVEGPMKAVLEHLQKDLLLKDFTRSAFLQHLAATGSALIGSDGAFSILHSVLQSSEQGVGGTGERQNLCSLYTDGSFKSQYAQKENAAIAPISTLCIAGYTHADRLKWILTSMISSDDGLLDRFMLWVSGGYSYYVEEEEAAYEKIDQGGGGFDLNAIIVEIAKLHELDTVYRFDDEGVELLNNVKDELTRRIRQDRYTVFAEIPECAGTTYHTIYEEQLTRIAVAMHVLFQLLTHKVNNTVCVHIPEVITFEVLQRSKELMDFITLQKEILLEVLIPGRGSEQADDSEGSSASKRQKWQ